MDVRTFVGKTAFFIAIVLFIAGFAYVFGQENSLTGVVVVVLALMMLGQDLSVRPGMNMLGLMAFTLLMGLGAYASVACGDARIGAVVNFATVFVLAFMTTQDLRSPMHFPFLLGYAFMLSVPVSAEELPIRILALLAGSVFIVALNVLVNRGRHARTCHNGIASICSEIGSCCDRVLESDVSDSSALDSLCLGLRSTMYDRLRRNFFSPPGDRKVLDLVSTLQMMGHAVCDRERDPVVLRSVKGLMSSVCEHEGGGLDAAGVVAAVTAFIESNPGADSIILASAVSMKDELASLASEGDDAAGRHANMGAATREQVRWDSARFTFAVRISIVFTFFAFVWQYWEVENAKWLLFTAVALIVPYVNGSWRKSAMRLTGTLAGIAVFSVVLVAAGGDMGVLSSALILANYIYTVLDPKRYDVMMVFITFSALIAASISTPADDAVVERVLFVLLGVVASVAANYLVLPYRISDENRSLSTRYLKLNDRMLSFVGESLDGRRGGEDMASLTASSISSKLHMNLEAEGDPDASMLLSLQDGVTARCCFLCRTSDTLSETGRRFASDALRGEAPGCGQELLTDEDRSYLSVLSATVGAQRRSREILAYLG